MNANNFSDAHDKTGIVASILNALSINGKQRKLIYFKVALTLLNNYPNDVLINLAQHLII